MNNRALEFWLDGLNAGNTSLSYGASGYRRI
jgi:hypothetical protein